MSRRRTLLAAAALVLPLPTAAQSPQGGQVVAGTARITHAPGRTDIAQSSNRAIIQWQGFDVGAGHQVDIRQPSAQSWSLQRVTGGSPSAIAGRVTSNGGVALVNPAGVVFHQGAQVDVGALIATGSDITNQNFMAGRMAFEGRPHPGARIENRGTITVREQGLAALVGPSVANSGSIRARFGRVAMAGGAEGFALDLAGDGLLSIDVTRQVQQAPDGGVALVTNAGRIEAASGQVLLSATAASGVLENLVLAGGEIIAPGGQVALQANGGGVRITGAVQAASGRIAATANGEVRLATGALLDASGGGGRVVIGGSMESRPGAPQRLAGRATVERGATARADGQGGEVILHSTTRTAHHGRLSADRGTVEVSSRGALAVDGAMEAALVLIDPVTLRVVSSLSGATEPAEVTAASINATTGALTLQAERTIIVEASINKQQGPLTLETTNATALPSEGIRINRPVTVLGDLTLRSAGDIFQDASGARVLAGTLFAESSGGAVRLNAGTNVIRALAGGGGANGFDVATTTPLVVDGAITAPLIRLAPTGLLTLNAPLNASDTLLLEALRGTAQASGGAGITAGTLVLEAPLGRVNLTGEGNRITSLGQSLVPRGLSLTARGDLNLTGEVTGGQITLTVEGGSLSQNPVTARLTSPDLGVRAPGGSVLLDGPLNSIGALLGGARDRFVVDAGGDLLLSGPISADIVDLRLAGELAQDQGARLTAGTLRLSVIGGAAFLDDPLNRIAVLEAASIGGALNLTTQGDLRITGAVTAQSLALSATGAITQASGSSIGVDRLSVTALGGDALLDQPGNSFGTLGGSGAMRDLHLASTGPLGVLGALDAGRDLHLNAGAIEIAAPVRAGRRLSLSAAAGDVAQLPGGTLAAPSLTALSPQGSVRLEASGNALAAVSGSSLFEFRLATSGSPDLGAIAAPEVALTAGGDLVQAAGGPAIEANRLEAFAGGRIDLAAGNRVTRLGRMVAPGGLGFTTLSGLTLLDAITVPQARLESRFDLLQLPGAMLSAGTLEARSTAGSVLLADGTNLLPNVLGVTAAGDVRLFALGAMTLSGPVVAGGSLALLAGDTLRQLTGSAGLTATRLDARSINAEVRLDGAGNAIGALGEGGAQGGFFFAHAGAAPLRLEGLISAPSISLALPQGLVQGSGGALRTSMLTLDSGGAVTLDAPGHVVPALGGRASALTLVSESTLSVVDPLAIGGLLALSAESIGFAAPVAAGSATLLASAGDISQAAGGTLGVAGALRVEAAQGAVTLPEAGNGIARLTLGVARGEFELRSADALVVAGPVTGATILLAAAQPMTLDGVRLTAGRAVLLATPLGLAGGQPSSLIALNPGGAPVLIVDSRAAGLVTLPSGILPDIPGLPPEQQATQLADFGTARNAPGGPVVLDMVAPDSAVFLLLDSGPALGVVDASRLGLLGTGSSAFLLGSVGGVAGAAAAISAQLAGGDANYRFNACPIGVPNCGATPPGVTDPPSVSPPALPVSPPPITTAPTEPLPPGGEFALSLPPLALRVVSWADLRAAGQEPPLPWQGFSLAWPLPDLLQRPGEE